MKTHLREVYERILTDMKSIWGEMAFFMLKKRLTDIKADIKNLSKGQLENIVELLRSKTLPSTLGSEGAEAKANQYRSWIENNQTPEKRKGKNS